MEQIFMLVFFAVATALASPCQDAPYSCVPGTSCPANCSGPQWVCSGSNESGLVCDHRDFDPQSARSWGVVVVLFWCLALASSVGVGGGGLVIPLLSLIVDAPAYYSIPLSVTSIFGASIVLLVAHGPAKHPNTLVRHRPRIDFHAVLVFLPSTLAGTVVGVLLNQVSPAWLVLVLILFVLSYAGYRTLKRGISQFRAESAKGRVYDDTKRAVLRASSSSSGNSSPINDNDDDGGGGGGGGNTVHRDFDTPMAVLRSNNEWHSNDTAQLLPAETADESEPAWVQRRNEAATAEQAKATSAVALQQILGAERKFPWPVLAACLAMLAILSLLSLLRGGRSGSTIDHLQCGSAAYAALLLVTFAFLLACTVAAVRHTLAIYRRKVTAGYTFVEGDLHFTTKRTVFLAAIMMLAGFLAGFLGIGGGMVISPILLNLGMLPMVSSATTAHMTLYTSASSTVQFIVLGRVPKVYGAVLFFTAMGASYAGQSLINRVVKRFNRPSIMIFVVGAVVLLSLVLLLADGTLNIVRAVQEHKSFGFQSLCLRST